MIKPFLAECNNIFNKFTNVLSDVTPACAGILPSEALAFCALCRLHKVDLIIESGIENGISTEIFAKFFPSIKIHTVDTKVRQSTVQKLSVYDNVNISEGNGTKFVPRTISNHRGCKIAVFIDGPKDAVQLKLAQEIVNDVEFVACHDIGKEYCYGYRVPQTYINFKAWNKRLFDTTEEWYTSLYAYLNVDMLRWLQGSRDTPWPVRNDGYDAALHNPILEMCIPKGFGLGVGVR